MMNLPLVHTMFLMFSIKLLKYVNADTKYNLCSSRSAVNYQQSISGIRYDNIENYFRVELTG